MTKFVGCKVALICGEAVVATQRDDTPGILWPDMWELPGGAREGDESVEACAIREVQEELGLVLLPEGFVWKKAWPAMHDAAQTGWFLVALVDPVTAEHIQFGDEGRGWRLMPVTEFLARDDVIPGLKLRLKDFLEHSKG